MCWSSKTCYKCKLRHDPISKHNLEVETVTVVNTSLVMKLKSLSKSLRQERHILLPIPNIWSFVQKETPRTLNNPKPQTKPRVLISRNGWNKLEGESRFCSINGLGKTCLSFLVGLMMINTQVLMLKRQWLIGTTREGSCWLVLPLIHLKFYPIFMRITRDFCNKH